MKHIFLLFIFLLEITGCSSSDKCNGKESKPPALNILFIGNSYTMANDLPGVFTSLACAGGYKVSADISAYGGWTLADHYTSPKTADKLNQQKWDYVILQEQSEIPAIEYSRTHTMYPAVRHLVSQIRKIGAKPILFVTWGHRDGLPGSGLPTYNDMQTQLNAGYSGIARELNVTLAPVGSAWRVAQKLPTPLSLWQEDGSHPAMSGTYLAACVLYAVIYQESPLGLTYYAGLSQDMAKNLQTIAADTVLK